MVVIPMDDASWIRLLKYFNLSESGYHKVRKGVKKRIARHMQALNLSRMDDYLKLIDQDDDVRKRCFLHLTVSVSRFFRDRCLWDELGGRIIPELLGIFSDEPRFNVWSCGCARGEEVYGFLMLWENLDVQHKIPPLDLIATDVNPEYIRMARESIYDYRSLRELPAVFVEKYFSKIPSENRYKLHSHLKEMVTFKQHNFMEESPPSKEFHLIFARNNLLTYYHRSQNNVALLRIIKTLKPGGIFVVGSRENIPADFFELEHHPVLTCVYTKKPSESKALH